MKFFLDNIFYFFEVKLNVLKHWTVGGKEGAPKIKRYWRRYEDMKIASDRFVTLYNPSQLQIRSEKV